MQIIKPPKGFLIKVHHTLKLPDKVFQNDSFKYWNPVLPGYVERVRLGPDPDEYYDDLEYYEYFDDERLIYTPLLFNEEFQKLAIPLFKNVIEANFQNLQELLQFPFRDNDFPYYFSDGSVLDILEEFEKFQKQLKSYALGIVKGYPEILNIIRAKTNMVERNVCLNGFYQGIANDKLFNLQLDKKWRTEEERDRDPEYRKWLLTPIRITVFEGWGSYLLWELLSKIEGDLSISACKKCGSILDIKPGKHQDRQLCGKEENLKCWQAQRNERIKKYRRTHRPVSSL